MTSATAGAYAHSPSTAAMSTAGPEIGRIGRASSLATDQNKPAPRANPITGALNAGTNRLVPQLSNAAKCPRSLYLVCAPDLHRPHGPRTASQAAPSGERWYH